MKIGGVELAVRAAVGEVVLGGNVLRVVALTMAQTEAIAATKPRPVAGKEMLFDRTLGRSVPVEKDDPAVEKLRREWAEHMQCAEIAAAAGIESRGGLHFDASAAADHNARWAAEIVDEMKRAFTWTEIERASRVIAELSSPAAQAGAAVKN